MRSLALLLLVVCLVGCDTQIHGSAELPDAALSVECLEATNHDDLPWLEQHVFYNSCAHFTSCHHSGGGAAEQMDLSPGHSWSSLVGRPSQESPGWQRVVPGDPDHSYLLVKLGDLHGPLGDAGTTMPPKNPLICRQKRDAVRRWIAAGAPSAEADAGAILDGGIAD